MRLLDLFCCAGGAGTGYNRAGFEVVGVDIDPQPRYPFEFVQRDAMEVLNDTAFVSTFDAIHASPPCQSYSRAMKHLAGPKPMLIDEVRRLLKRTDAVWAIENVEGSDLPIRSDLFGSHGVMLCGSGFGLKVQRHRLFETSFAVTGPGCLHRGPAMNPHNVRGRELIYEAYGNDGSDWAEKVWAREMGVPWMNRQEAREAIPPVFTEHIGSHMADELREHEAVAA